MKKIPLIIFFVLMMSFVSADGMIHIYEDDLWKLQSETQQLAAINYQDGFENLIISIDIDDNTNGKKAVWIFPVPAKADDVAIDILKQFPRFGGNKVESEFDDVVGTTSLVMAGYSLFPISLPLVIWFAAGPMVMSQASLVGMGKDFGGNFNDVVVHERIQQDGLTTELITSTHGNTLKAYLTLKGYSLPQESKDMLDYYVGEDYTFVISYIDDLEEFKQQAQQTNQMYGGYNRYSETAYSLAVSVKFPTDEIYFPLKPTSIYGSESIPIAIYVMDYVTPKLYPKIKQQAEVDYYRQRYYSISQDLENFFNQDGSISGLKYTQIKLTAPSKYFEEDLWIKDSAPVSISIKDGLSRTPWIWGILLFAIFSMLASLVSGKIVFKEDLSKRKLLLFGLWNLLTFIGLFIATIVLKTKRVSLELEKKLQQENVKVSIRDYRKVGFMFLFYGFFLAFIGAFFLLFSLI